MEVSHRVHLSKMCSLYTAGKRVSNHVISINEPLCGILLKYQYFKKCTCSPGLLTRGKKNMHFLMLQKRSMIKKRHFDTNNIFT